MQAKEFIRRYCGEVPLKEEWVSVFWFVTLAVIEEVVYGLVREATWAG